MGFMNVLQKIGQGAAKAGAVAAQIEGYEGVAKLLLPHTVKIDKAEAKLDVALTDVDTIVKQMQVIGEASGLTGAQKLEGGTALLTQLVAMTEHLQGKDVGDPQLVQQGLKKIVDGWVDVQKGLKG